MLIQIYIYVHTCLLFATVLCQCVSIRFEDGFSVFGVLDALRKYPSLQKSLCPAPALTSATMKSLFSTVHTSAVGSDRYKQKLQRRAWLDDFLDLISSGKCILFNDVIYFLRICGLQIADIKYILLYT